MAIECINLAAGVQQAVRCSDVADIQRRLAFGPDGAEEEYMQEFKAGAIELGLVRAAPVFLNKNDDEMVAQVNWLVELGGRGIRRAGWSLRRGCQRHAHLVQHASARRPGRRGSRSAYGRL